MTDIQVGSKVKVVRVGAFFERWLNAVGTVKWLNVTNEILTVQFENGCDSGYVADVELVKDERPTRDEWLPKAIELYKNGKKSREISKELGIPARTVRHNLQQYKEQVAATFSEDIEEVLAPLPLAPRKPTIFVIPDTQCKQGVDLDYLRWVGNYIAKKKPDIIVHIGDHYDMASLSTYDKGQLSAEGRRVKADIEAGDEGIRIIEEYIAKVPNYHPRKVVTLGNHEERIDRFVNYNPEFEGYIGTDKLAFADYGWEVYPFLKPVNICGINFVHYIQNPMTGKPLGGTALNRLKSVGESFVMGHVQTYDFCQRPLQLSGKNQIGLIVGACYVHDEGYKGIQGNHHFRGCVMLYECADGYAMHKAVTLDHMREIYERG